MEHGMSWQAQAPGSFYVLGNKTGTQDGRTHERKKLMQQTERQTSTEQLFVPGHREPGGQAGE